jgi:septal ring factor EnvC (AmiA/AmiB activator)
MTTGFTRRGSVALSILTVLLLLAAPPAGAASPTTDPRAQREEVRARRAATAQSLDSLRATDGEVRAALDGLDQNLADGEQDLAAADAAVAAALKVVADADAAVAASTARIDHATKALKSLSIGAYTGAAPAPSPFDLIAPDGTNSAQIADEDMRTGLTQYQSGRLDDALTTLRVEEQLLASAKATAQSARAKAEAQQAEQATRVQALQQTRDQQLRLIESLQDRIDQTLSEADSLAGLDQQLSTQIVQQEQALAARLKAAAEKAAADKAAAEKAAADKAAADAKARAAATTVKGSKTTVKATTTAKGSTSTTKSPGNTTPQPGSSSSSGSSGSTRVGTVQVVDVDGITVAVEIADQVHRLMVAARAAGLRMSGGGFRDPQAQIETRRANCGPTDYDIFDKPGFLCNPPTARPGHSMHEKGLAIDFTCDGAIVDRGDKCFTWLQANAAKNGLYNLPAEPWHWSTNGN